MLPILPQKQPNNWSCLATACSMVLGLEVQKFFDFIGHDGSEIIWPENPEPYNRRGHHIQELTWFARVQKVAITQFERKPGLGNPVTRSGLYILPNMCTPDLFFEHRMVMCGLTNRGAAHALAWTGDHYIDPQTGEKVSNYLTVSLYLNFDSIIF